MPKSKQIVVGIFSDPDQILHAADGARTKGWKQIDAIVPYPIHGLDGALGLKMSWVPWVTFVMGLTGASLGLYFQYWVSAVDWPINIGGKPNFPWPAYIPITFESGILIGGISTFFAVWAACKLPNKNPRIYDERFTDDKFGLVVPLREGVSESDVVSYMKGAGADEVRVVEA